MKYSLEIVEKIINLIKAGNYKETAALASGISTTTFYRWVDEKKDFREAVKKASAEAETRNVLIIQNAAKKTWQAAAWWLERTDAKKWGRQEKIEIISEKFDQMIEAFNKIK